MNCVRFVTLCALLLTASAVFAGEDQQPDEIRFNRDIRPILSEHCFACHGPDAASRQGELRLDVSAGAVESGAVVPGKSGDSELIARITSDDPDLLMPPPDANKPLKPEQKELLARWIDSGAKWEAHWAFIKPQKTALPQTERAAQWARNPIDHFTLAKLNELGLEPNAPADRHTLARRAALDLTGLPPDRTTLDAYLADDSAGAYSRYVDALLASAHYGEHRGRFWLDAARYGDTHGMHVDNYREMWPYRDWVVGAFNNNMPFDRFVLEQIAGDLLPETTLETRIATGFSRCNISTSEGGAIPEEVNVRYMIDRVETTATVFLGLTAGCAVCHDHKYDPFTQREFYRLGAYFNNTTQPPMDGNQKDAPPVVTLPRAEFEQEWNTLQAQRRKLRHELSRWESSPAGWWPDREREILHSIADDALSLWLPLTEGESGQATSSNKDEAKTETLPPVALPESATWATGHPAGRRGMRFEGGVTLSVDTDASRTDRPLSISFWIRTPDRLLSSTIFDRTGKSKEGKTVGWKITTSTQGGLSFTLYDAKGAAITGNLPGEEALRPRKWQHVCVRYSGGQSNSSITILVDGRQGHLRNGTENLIEATEIPAAELKIAPSLPTGGLSDLRVFDRWLSGEEVEPLGSEFELKKLLAGDGGWNDLAADDRETLTRFYEYTVDEGFRNTSRELAGTQLRRDFIYSRSTTTMVMQERATPARAWVLERGEYDQRRDEVAPGVPSMLPALPEDAPKNRLALAQWLVDPDHPLTARVFVNCLWQSMFGTGLVKTAEDFGVMGERPSHPELLDWLAVEFVESGWDVKHLVKLIVTSATYRQSSTLTPEKIAGDRANRYFSRGPRLRLDAEVLRDQALAVSGLLNREVGGPSVRPYQPVGLWRVVAITGSNTRDFKQDTGAALYRRSVYTFWKRTSPPPSMAAFNAPTREQCTVRRERTNTPLQALVLMNDPQFVESARHLAQNGFKQHPDDENQRAAWMLTAVLSKPAEEQDLKDVMAAVAEFRTIFQSKPDAAKSLIATGDSKPDELLDPVELAAWTMAANTLMNRDDFINKE